MKRYFELSKEQINIKNTLKNKHFMEIEIYAISNAEPNRNDSCFTLESMQHGLSSFVNKPIIGSFEREDFGEHDGQERFDSELGINYWDNSQGEQVLGLIRESDTIDIVKKDNLSWIYCTAMIYTQYNFKQAKRLLKDRSKKVSVEVNILKSENKDGIEYIYEFELLGITILGSKNGVPINEGIAGAHLSVLDIMDATVFQTQTQVLNFAYNKLEQAQRGERAMELKINKDKEDMSYTPWGEVDKQQLAHKIVEAQNFKEVAKVVYLELKEGWEEGQVSKLGYPVMEIKKEEVVYNREGLAAAKAYATQHNNSVVLDKLKTIYKELDLDEQANKEMEEKYVFYISLYEQYNEEEDKKQKGEQYSMEEMEKMQAQCDELTMKCTEVENKYTELEEKYKLSEEKCAQYEEQCNDFANKLQAYEDKEQEFEAVKEEMAKMKAEKQVAQLTSLSEKLSLSEDEVKEVSAKCSAGLYISFEEMEKEVSYIAYKKVEKANNNKEEKEKHFSAPIIQPIVSQGEQDHKNETLLDRLAI